MSVSPVPAGYHTVTPYLIVDDVDRLITFLEQGLGAKLCEKHGPPGGPVMHADVLIGDSHVMMGSSSERHAAMPAMLYLYVPDTDGCYARAVAAGGQSIQTPVDMPYGDRNAAVRDFAGNEWWIGTRQENLTPEELGRRMAAKQ